MSRTRPKLRDSNQTTVLLIAGDYSLHSEAIRNTLALAVNRPNARPYDLALMYGREMQAIKRRHAEDLYLAPLGLNTDLLGAQQKEMTSGLSTFLSNRCRDIWGRMLRR